MPHSIAQRVARWDATDGSVHFGRMHEVIEFLADRRFGEYEPTDGPVPEFRTRLRDWLNGLPNDDDQQALFQLVPHMFFVGRREFQALYRDAFSRVACSWLVKAENLQLDSPSFDRDLRRAVAGTWFCPVTDSMQIAAFHHVNRITGANFRPDWYSLAQFGDAERVRAYCRLKRYRHLVLLEDFVGTGSQMKRALEFAGNLSPQIGVLALPLIACPAAMDFGAELERRFPHLTFEAALALPHSAFVKQVPAPGEDPMFAAIRELIIRTEGVVRGSMKGRGYAGPFGYKETGGVVVMSSNCPDNSLSIIHYSSDSWSPLFPRSSRV